jgi:hypothetical protein
VNWNPHSSAIYFSLTALISLLVPPHHVSKSPQEDVLFRWRLQRDNLLTYELKQETSVSSEIDGRRQRTDVAMSLFMDARVVDAIDGVASIEQSVTRVTLKLSTPEAGGIKTIEFDSDSAKQTPGLAEQLASQIKPLIGSTFTVKMTERGDIVSIDIPNTTMDRLREAPSSMQLRKVLTVDALKQLFGDTAVVFPEQAPAVKESWQLTDSVQNAIGTIERKHTFTNQGEKQIGGKSAYEISVKTEIAVEQPGENEARVDDFQGEGLIWFDPNEGIVTEGEVRNRLETSRSYRDKIIHTTVDSLTEIKVARK